MPPERYYAQHPEWYSLIDGKRVVGNHVGQLCLTNDEMRKELTRNALEWIRRNPNAQMISISQNDWLGPCQCTKCQALVEKEGSEAGPMLHFVNAVAAEIEKKYPSFMVDTLAYQYSRKTPLYVRPHDNVIIRLCSIEADFSRPLDSEYNASFRDDVKSWSKIVDNIYVWDYTTNLHNFLFPHPNIHVLGPNMRFFADHNVKGMFAQGNGYSIGGDFFALKAWLLGHLMWNPYVDSDKLIEEFIQGYYSKAGPYISKYINLIRKAYELDKSSLGCYSKNIKFMKLKDMNDATGLFSEALKAVGRDKQLLTRVCRARLPIDHLWLARYHEFKAEASLTNQPFLGPDDSAAALDDFRKATNELGAQYYGEARRTANYFYKIKAKLDLPPLELPSGVRSK